MMGERQVDQGALFYEFYIERHVPADHLLRAIDRFVDLSGLRTGLAAFYSSIGCPSIDPELLIRMLLVGYCYGIRSERRLAIRDDISSFRFFSISNRDLRRALVPALTAMPCSIRKARI